MPGSRFTDALSHADLGTLIEAIDEGFIVQDAALGVIAANTSAARLLGDTLALALYIDQIGQPIVPDQLPSRVALATGGAVKDVVVGVVRHDGRLLWLRVSAWPVDLGGGTPGVATLFVDVTAERVLIDEARRATDALTESETRLRSVLGSIDDYLYAWRYHADGSVEVTFESMPAASFLGWDSDSDAETVWRAAVVADDLAEFDERVLGAQRRAAAGEHDYRVTTQAGRVRWLHERWRARPLEDGSTLGEGIVSDITLRREMEEEISSALAEVQSAYAKLDQARGVAELLAKTDSLTGAANRREFRDQLAPRLANQFQAPGIALALLDIDHFKAVNDTYGHAAGDEVLVEVARRLGAGLRPGELLARWGGEEFAVFFHGVSDAHAARVRCEDLRRAIADEPVQIAQGELRVTVSVGAALATIGDEPDELVDRVDTALYQAKRAGRNRTRLVGEPVGRDDLDADLPDYVHVARALALAAGVREGHQDLHTEQVSDLAGRVAEALSLSPIAVMRCRLAGLLHDVGKVAVPDTILAKRGPLTPVEMEVMRSHSSIGAEIVRRISALAGTADAIRHHHERWDGSGYPDGLVGERIPLEARIVAAADAYSAMTSDRVYHDAREFEQALAELHAKSGSQFDPAIVEVLIRTLTDGRDAKRCQLGDADQTAA